MTRGGGAWNNPAALLPSTQDIVAGSRGIAGALGQLGADLDAKAKEAAAKERADALFAMQKEDHQMKVDAVAQAAKEKEAANKYASVLGAATSGNVVGIDDQAKLAAIAQDTKLTPEQQATKMEGLLPAMTKKYEASPEEQLKIVRASNPLGGLENIAPTTRIALLKEAEAPMEKMQALNAAAATKREEALIRAQERAFTQAQTMNMQKIMADSANENRRAIAEMNRQTQLEAARIGKDSKDNSTYLVNNEGKLVGTGAYRTYDEALKAASMFNKDDGVKIYDAATYRSMFDTKGDKEGSSGGSGKAGKGTTDEDTAYSGKVAVPDQDFSVFGVHPFGKGDSKQTNETMDLLQAIGYSGAEVDTARKNQNAFNSDSYLNESNIDSVLLPKQTKDGILIPPSIAMKLAAVRDKQLFLDGNGKFSLTNGIVPTPEQLKDMGLEVKADSKGKQVLTEKGQKPATDRVLPTMTADTKFKKATDEDIGNLKILQDQIAYSSPAQRERLLPEINRLKLKIQNGGELILPTEIPTAD